jgi:GMP synthase (glutamine-hydrolysing)
MTDTRSLLLIKIAGTLPVIAESVGDYDLWFRDSLPAGARLDVANPLSGEMPDFHLYDGIIVSGSPHSVNKPLPWYRTLEQMLHTAWDLDLPMLGVCFGHQFMARMRGGSVITNPDGFLCGPRPVQLEAKGEDHFLFQGLPAQFQANYCNFEIVSLLPEGGEVLALGPHGEPVAMSYKEKVVSVQFHPEATARIAETWMRHFGQEVAGEGDLQSAGHFGRKIMENFFAALPD